MSRDVHFTGKLKKVTIKINLEETCKEILNKPLPRGYDSYEEWLREDSYLEYYFMSNDLYKVEMEEVSPEENLYLIEGDRILVRGTIEDIVDYLNIQITDEGVITIQGRKVPPEYILQDREQINGFTKEEAIINFVYHHLADNIRPKEILTIKE